ncbi:hypothetical protein LLG46_15820 [bacterium]|nr:hypothetical protein [bacterium]
MDEHESERMTGQKGGASEAFIHGHHYYEPSVTAITDIIVPATRIQWGPTFAGLLVALSVTFLFTALGIALGIGVGGMGYWIVGFGSLGLFLGSMLAARTAKADVIPAIMHGVIVWCLAMVLHTITFGGVLAAVVASTMDARAPTPITTVISDAAWWFFGGFLIFLVASILGGLAGINPPEHEETHETTTTT